MPPAYFQSAADFRKWLVANYNQASELLVGFYKKDSGRPSITYPEALDEALAFGWIDGVRRSVDSGRYTVRFTPRKPRSNWSDVNIKRVHELIKLGKMAQPGMRAFEQRDEEAAAKYSYERKTCKLDSAQEKQFRANQRAWEFFQEQPPSYQRPAIWWVVSAKQEATRQKRLATLIRDSAAEKRLAMLSRPSGGKRQSHAR